MNLDKMREILHMDDLSLFSIREMLKICEAYWSYSGQPGEPHALLANNINHSDAYFNVSALLGYANIRKELAKRLASKLTEIGITKIDIVLSSSFGGMPVGQALADEIGAAFVFTEKVDGEQKWTGRFEIPVGAIVLPVEELITSLKTTIDVKKAVMNVIGPNSSEFVKYQEKPLVLTIVHRPGELPIEYTDFSVIGLLEQVVHNWEPGECLICNDSAGAESKAMKPKPNWEEFLRFVQEKDL